MGSDPPEGVPDGIAKQHISRWRTFYIDIGILQAGDKLPDGCLGDCLSLLLGREASEGIEDSEVTETSGPNEKIEEGTYTQRKLCEGLPVSWTIRMWLWYIHPSLFVRVIPCSQASAGD